MDSELITSLLEDNEKNGWYIVWTIPKIIRVLLRRFPNEIDYKQLSQNTSYKAIELLTAKAQEEKKLIEENRRNYGVLAFSTKIIHWDVLSENPKAIELLKTKAKEEKELRNKNLKEYEGLYYSYRIDWDKMSANPKAIKLLEEKAIEEQNMNPKTYKSLNTTLKINWQKLSKNPKAIELLKTKASQEKELIETNVDVYNSLEPYNKIDWNSLSANPRAIQILNKYQEYIKIEGLCQNPNAVKLIKSNIDKLTDANWIKLSSNPCIFYEK